MYPYSIKALKTLGTQDGHALNADLYRNKTKVGSILDTGTGGGIWPSFIDKDEREQFSRWVATLGKVHFPGDSSAPAFSYPHDDDSAAGLLVTEYEAAQETRKMNRAAKTKLLYRTATDQENVYNETILSAATRNLPVKETVALYRQKAPWFRNVVSVWIAGSGWTPVESLQ